MFEGSEKPLNDVDLSYYFSVLDTHTAFCMKQEVWVMLSNRTRVRSLGAGVASIAPEGRRVALTKARTSHLWSTALPLAPG